MVVSARKRYEGGNIVCLVTGQVEVSDDLAKRDDLVREEVGKRLVCTSWDPQRDDVSDLGAICLRLHDTLAEVRLMMECRRTHQATLQGRAAFRTKGSSFFHHFTEENNNKLMVRFAGTDELSNEAVRGPRIGLPDEVHRVIELSE